MIFKIGFLILILFLLLQDRELGDLENLLYVPRNRVPEQDNKSDTTINTNIDTEKKHTGHSDDILSDVDQELSPEEFAQRIFDEI